MSDSYLSNCGSHMRSITYLIASRSPVFFGKCSSRSGPGTNSHQCRAPNCQGFLSRIRVVHGETAHIEPHAVACEPERVIRLTSRSRRNRGRPVLLLLGVLLATLAAVT